MKNTDMTTVEINRQVQSTVAPLVNILHEVRTSTKETSKIHKEDMEKILGTFNQHDKEDRDRASQSEERMDRMEAKIDKILAALFGDEETEEVGLVKKMKPILDAYTSVKWTFGVFLAVGGAILLIYNLVKLK